MALVRCYRIATSTDWVSLHYCQYWFRVSDQIVSPYPLGICSKTISGCLKPQIVQNRLYIHTYGNIELGRGRE